MATIRAFAYVTAGIQGKGKFKRREGGVVEGSRRKLKGDRSEFPGRFEGCTVGRGGGMGATTDVAEVLVQFNGNL